MRNLLTAIDRQDVLVNDALSCKGENVLLWGPPGTGKTYAAIHAHASIFDNVYATTVTVDTPAAEWRGFFIPKPDEKTGSPGMGWQDGLAVKAMGKVIAEDGTVKMDGKTNRFVINEIHKLGPDLAAIAHVVGDDRGMAEMALPNGDTVFSMPEFQVVATSNESPEALRGMYDALADRFTIRQEVRYPSMGAIESLPDDLQDFMLKMCLIDAQDPKHKSFRQVATFARLRTKFDALRAAQLVFEHEAEEVLNSAKLAGVKL